MRGKQVELIGFGTVLESPDHGPQLCLGALLMSLPPQGGGPPITNWDWSAVTGQTTLNGTTWGTYEVVGTFQRDELTLTRPPTSSRRTRPAVDLGSPPSTPCPEPRGGWRVLDRSRTTERHLRTTLRRARRLDGYAGSWLDQSVNPAARMTDDDAVGRMNDPRRLIINVAVTLDPAIAERNLRECWGGALCVSRAQHTKAELDSVRDEVLDSLLGRHSILSMSTGHDRVDLEVVHDDGSLQAHLDRQYGTGLVVVASALRPTGGR